jgi:hypothetical protein
MRLRYLISVLLVSLISSPLLAADRECVQPDVRKFLEQSRHAIKFKGFFGEPYESIFMPAEMGGARIQWMGASWYAPRGGALFVLDCDGRRLAALPLGAVMQLRKGPVVPRVGPTVEATYISGIGSGYLATSVAIVSFKKGAVSVMWRHEATASVREWAAVNYEATYQWTASPDGRVLRVVGSRVEWSSGGDPPEALRTPVEETWCWHGQKRQYQTCQDGAPTQ